MRSPAPGLDCSHHARLAEYHVWIKHFLETVEVPIVFYCSPDQHEYIAGLRGDKVRSLLCPRCFFRLLIHVARLSQPIIINSTYPTAFEMPPLENLGGEEWAIRQNKMDPENWMHVHEIYGIWTAKPWLVNEVAKANPYNSKYFMWVDAGSLREPNVPHPFTGLAKHMDEIYTDVPNDTLLLASTTVPFEEELDYVQNATRFQPNDPTERLQGGWYGGTKEAVDWWETETTKVVVLQSALNRCASFPSASRSFRVIADSCSPLQLHRQGAARVEPSGAAKLGEDPHPAERVPLRSRLRLRLLVHLRVLVRRARLHHPCLEWPAKGQGQAGAFVGAGQGRGRAPRREDGQGSKSAGGASGIAVVIPLACIARQSLVCGSQCESIRPSQGANSLRPPPFTFHGRRPFTPLSVAPKLKARRTQSVKAAAEQDAAGLWRDSGRR